MPENSDKVDPPPKRKRRWGKWLLVFCLLLTGLALWVNGPGSRWFLRKTIIEQLATRGLEGNATVSGQLWNGYTLENASFTGSGPLQTLKADHLSVRYRLPDLLSKKIDVVEARGVRITLHPEPSQKEKKDWRESFEPLRKFHPLVAPIKLDLQDIVVDLHLKDKEPREISLGSLSHARGSDEFIITQFSPGKILREPAPSQDLVLTWSQSALLLDQFTVVPQLKVRDLVVQYETGQLISAQTEVGFQDAVLSLNANEEGDATIKLGEAPLDLAQVLELLALSQPLTGHLQHLEISARDLLAPPAQWGGTLALATNAVTWQERPLPDSVLDAALTKEQWTTQLKVAGDALTLDLTAPPPPVGAKKDWWKDLTLALALKCPSFSTAIEIYENASGKELPDTLPGGALATTGTITLGRENPVQNAQLDWQANDLTMRDRALPDLKGTVAFENDLVSLTTTRQEQPKGESLDIEATYHLSEKSYQAATKINLKKSEWLGRLLVPEKPTLHPVGPLVLQWAGSGDLEKKIHRGTYHLETLTGKFVGESLTNASAKGAYEWPGSVSAETLAIRNGQLELSGGVAWSPKRSSFKELKLADGKGILATVNGTGPGGPKLKDLFEAETPFDLKIQAKELRLVRLRALLPLDLDPAYQATFNADLSLTGTPERPKLDGSFSVTEVATPNKKIPALALTTKFATTDGRLGVTGTLTEPAGPLATLQANIPVEVEKWAKDPALLNQVPLSAKVLVKDLPLNRLQIVAPALKSAEGLLDVNLTVSGTTSAPVYNGTAEATLKSFPLAGTPYQAIRDTKIRLLFDKDRVRVEPSSTTIAGGKLILSGQAILTGPEPVLDFRLDADHSLLWRNDLFIARTSGHLNLKGPFKSARLTGQLGIVDSLFYKDIEIIPLKAPSATINAPELPKFSKGKKAGGLSFNLPAPVADWPVDIRITTQDPFLVRGNLATGEASGDVTIRGTVANPKPEGKITLRSVEAALPFSTLKITRGSILIRPGSPLDPLLDLRGRSTVNSTSINIYVFGPVSNPKYNLSSDPPLPESELLALLATGATTADLEDPALAQMRLFQLLVDETRRKANSADAHPMLKVFRKPLNTVKDLNLRVAENDPFSGRKFNSATMELSDKWSGVVQIDNEGNTRGLLRYSLRFK